MPTRKGLYGALADAEQFLRESGVLGVSRSAQELVAEAKNRGIADRTLRRARAALKVPVRKDGLRAGWWWGPREGANNLGASASRMDSPRQRP